MAASNIDAAFASIEWCVSIRNVTSAAFASEFEAKNYRDLINRAASARSPVAHLWRVDFENDRCIRQIDQNYPNDTQYAGLPSETWVTDASGLIDTNTATGEKRA